MSKLLNVDQMNSSVGGEGSEAVFDTESSGAMDINFARLILADPRLELLSVDAIGIFFLIHARMISGHQTPSKPSLAMRILRASSARVLRLSLTDLMSTAPPLITEVDGFYYAGNLSSGSKFPVARKDPGASPGESAEMSGERPGSSIKPNLAQSHYREVDSTVVGDGLRKSSSAGLAKRCPANEIFELFIRICIDLPSIQPVAGWHPQRMTKLEALWKKQPNLKFWEEYFTTVHESDFLCGRGGRTWRADFDWILKLPNFCKIIEKTYKNRGRANGSLFHAGASAKPENYGSTQIDQENEFAKMAKEFEG